MSEKAEFYKFSALSLQGTEISMESYADQVVLVVNTASKCGFTPQFAGLEKLYQQYKDRGFVVLGFPCNQFAGQEPGDENAIADVCSLNYGVTFPMFAKIEVNGAGAHPLYVYLKNALGGLLGGSIKWNFTKFLLDRSGKPVQRFAPITVPEKIADYVEPLL
jgi:glutathione peroxidase